ncbi:serpentine type 7TM GPCR chemoreceptor srx domain-containing protein [Ditylenchus destructor]|uniref:Serpentine type 7TM GPCR chemoreceptor srx domain-containing protein n=1 Tax=Ditylenchus destructor TaxID=166010 RepID=A0AAD4N308_9BILA|nr:serpentine type 7TM GPCR chemoreceptor srx domain-containing protein [Ditylenchus destructor]
MTVFTQVFIGSLLGMASGIALLLNLSVLFVLYRGGFLRSAQNPIFILTFLNVFGDSMQCAWILIYLTPTSISQSFIFPYKEKGAVALLFAYLFQLQWYQCVLTQMLMSVNRLVVVVLPNFQRIFSRRNVIIITLMVFPTSAVLSVIADIILPCCTTYYYWGTFSYKFFGEGTNYKNLFMDIPLNATTSTLSLICYGTIFLFVYKSNRGVHLQSNPNIATRRKQNEIRYALQFGLISLFFLAAWVTFRILPLLVPPTMPEWFSLTAFCVIAHCSANSFIYLTMNKEFKAQFASMFRICSPKLAVNNLSEGRLTTVTTNVLMSSYTTNVRMGSFSMQRQPFSQNRFQRASR